VTIGTISSEVGQQALTIQEGGNIGSELYSPLVVSHPASTTSGSCATGNYYYEITALDGSGGQSSTDGTQYGPIAVTGPTGSVTFTWLAATGATSYRVYSTATNGASGSENVYYTGTGTSFTVTCSGSTSGTPPAVTTAYAYKINGGGNSYFDGGNIGIGTATPGNLLSVGGLTTAQSSYQLAVSTGGTTNGGILVQDVAGQSSGEAFEVQNSTDTPLAYIDYQGNLTVQAATINGTLTVNGHIITGNTSGSTTAAAQIAIGTSGTCNLSPTNYAAGNDTSGTITLTPGGTGIANGIQCIITFGSAYGHCPHVVITPADSPSQILGVYGEATGTDTFNIGLATAGSSGTTYTFNYFIAQ
jgi:hypothetical protein